MDEMQLLRQDKINKLIDDSVYAEAMKKLNNTVSDVNAEISRIERKEIELSNANIRYNEYLRMLNTLDIENLTNSQLKKVFNKIIVKDRGVKDLYLCFNYNFLDLTEEELTDQFDETINFWVKVR